MFWLLVCFLDCREAAYQFDTYKIVSDSVGPSPARNAVLSQDKARQAFIAAIGGRPREFPAEPQMAISEEQAAVIRSDLITRNDILYVPSFAGTGKTTTILHYALARPNVHFLYLSYTSA